MADISKLPKKFQCWDSERYVSAGQYDELMRYAAKQQAEVLQWIERADSERRRAEKAEDYLSHVLLGCWDDYLKGSDYEAHTALPGEPEPWRPPARISGLDFAAKVLEEAGEPLDCRTIVVRALAKGYSRIPLLLLRTPTATLYAAILRDIRKYETNSRFREDSPGKFARREEGEPTDGAAHPHDTGAV